MDKATTEQIHNSSDIAICTKGRAKKQAATHEDNKIQESNRRQMTQSAVVKTGDNNKNDSSDNNRQKSVWGSREGWCVGIEGGVVCGDRKKCIVVKENNNKGRSCALIKATPGPSYYRNIHESHFLPSRT